MNGSLTLGENIADNSGVEFSIEAYKKLAHVNGPEARLPGLEQFTPEQMYWISFGQLWCRSAETADDAAKIVQDVHSPFRFRVMAVAQNSHSFSKDFNCPAGAPMNPSKKCKVW